MTLILDFLLYVLHVLSVHASLVPNKDREIPVAAPHKCFPRPTIGLVHSWILGTFPVKMSCNYCSQHIAILFQYI